MNRVAIKVKKHLSFHSLHQAFSTHVQNIKDHRRQGSCDYSLNDAVMSGFACMYFQDPSLAEFQRQLEKKKHQNNVRNLFGVQNIPKDSQLRDIVDRIESEEFRPVFSDFFSRLQRGKYLTDYQIIPGHYICAIDGVYHHSSQKVHCRKCLSKTHKNGKVTYSHGVLQGAIVHPDKKQIIPVMPEPISNADGTEKQDCEINAAKRFIKHLKKDHPRLGLIITGDGLFSKDPMIEIVKEHGMHYLFVAKPDDHTYMMEWLSAYDHLPNKTYKDITGREHRYTYKNAIPLNAKKDASQVNYIHYELCNKEGKVTYRNSWVTDIEVNDKNVIKLVRGGRCRWKIENECFNTLKNQGYFLNHNFGHGDHNLSHNMYLLTLLAFFYHQIFELSDPAYQLCRKSYVAKKQLWMTYRIMLQFFIFDSWDDVMMKSMEESEEMKLILKE